MAVLTPSFNSPLLLTPVPPALPIVIYAPATGNPFSTVPNVVGLLQATASGVITGAGLTVGTVTTAFDLVQPAGHVISQAPAAGGLAVTGAPVQLLVSLGSASTVPNIVGLTVGAGTTVLTANLLVLGSTLAVFSPTVAAGLIISQSPAAGSVVGAGASVSVIVSKGPAPIIVPDVVGLTVAAARIAITNAGLVVGTTLPVVTEATPIGSVDSQSPLPGTIVAANSLVNLAVAVFLEPFDLERTVISQYANSPVLLRLVNNMQQYIDPRANFEAFYNFVWNIDTAVGFGLDIWGRIIGVSRLLQLSSSETPFGFENADFPYDWQNFGGGTFRVTGTGTAYVLPDDAYRVLLLTKALANIVATTAPALNQLLQNLFPNRGPAYVVDNGGMDITFTFGFPLSVVELAILTQSGALPHPAGVSFNVVVVP